jgi:peptidoglycan/xylan/chitin deacetylase (PgdA/CDA1 family)
LLSNYDVAVPLLNEFEFCGWFFIPTEFVDLPPKQQIAFARQQRIKIQRENPRDGRVAMNWNEVRQIAANHVVGCHTKTHRRLGRSVTEAEMHAEIVHSRRRLEQELNRQVPVFCWVGGEMDSYSQSAAQVVKSAGYRYSFMTASEPITPSTDPLQIQRTNVESHWPAHFVRFQCTGILDRLYRAKRRRVLAETNTHESV